MSKTTTDRTLILEKIGLGSLSVLLVVLPYRGMNTIKDISLLAAFLVFAVMVYLRWKSNLRLLPLPSKSVPALFAVSILWALLSLVSAIDPSYSLREILTGMAKQYATYFIAFTLIGNSPSDTGKLRWLLLPAAISLVIMSAYGCYQFSRSPVLFENRITGFTGEFYRMSVLLVLMVPPMFSLASVWGGRMATALISGIPVVLAALFFTFTRSAWIAVFTEAALFILILYRRRWKYFLASALIPVAGFVFLSAFSLIPKILLVHGSEQHRIDALQYSAGIISKSPLTGIGYGKQSFSMYYPDIYVKHAHNIFVNAAVETGIPGSIVIIVLMTVVLRSLAVGLRQTTDDISRHFITGFLLAAIGFLILNMFDYMYHGWPGQMFWLFIGLGHAVISRQRENP